MTDPKSYTSGFVTSKDGTKIHYRQIGSGEGVVLVHGGLMYSKNFMRLAELLANEFTVYIPDRSGRALSEAHPDHSLVAEGEDIHALLEQTNTQYLFGLSSGAIVALQAAILNGALKKLALYEPPIVIDCTADRIYNLNSAYDRSMAGHNYTKAFVNFIKGTDDEGISLMKLIPNFIMVPMMKRMIDADAKKERGGDEMSLRSLIEAMRFDNNVAEQSRGIIEKAKNIEADILLLGGEKSQQFLKDVLDELSAELPEAKKIIFPGVGHIAADNSGRPGLVAEQLRSFFKAN